MEIFWLDSVDSTHTYAKNLIDKEDKRFFAVTAKRQTAGIGSRGNCWEESEKAVYLSAVAPKAHFPTDLPIHSTSIYIAFKICEYLRTFGSVCWMKWPNDLYVGEKKIGGVITNLYKNSLLWGVGINQKNSAPSYGILDVDIAREALILGILQSVYEKEEWKQIFRKVQIEFYKGKQYSVHIDGEKIAFKDAILLEDGSIDVGGVRKFSLR